MWSEIGTPASRFPQQATLAGRITLCHTLAPTQTSFISNIKTPLQAVPKWLALCTTGFWAEEITHLHLTVCKLAFKSNYFLFAQAIYAIQNVQD